MINITDKSKCCGCNVCGDICAKKAITFKTDIEGFWYPEVNKELCTDCGLCEKVCPIINVDTLKHNDLPQSDCFAAIHKNLSVRLDSTSGGSFSALADHIYRQGGYVGGAIWNEDWSVKHFISSESEDLKKLRSSKYLQSDAQGFYKAVRDLLNADKKVIVCGTPCQMAALRAFLRKPYENLIIVDFICRGINSPKVFRKYLDYLEDTHNSKIVYFKAKSKDIGWRQLTNKVIFDNNDVLYDTKDISPYMIAYLKTNAICRPSCYSCKFKGMPRMSDITLADFWGGEKVIGKDMDGDMGTSLILANSMKGKKYLANIRNSMKIKPVPYNSIFAGNAALLKSLPMPKIDRTAFYQDIDNKPFEEVIKKYIKIEEPQLTFKQKIYLYGHFFKAIFGVSQYSISTFWTNFKYNLLDKRVKTDILKGQYMLIFKHTNLVLNKEARIRLGGVLELGVKGRFGKSDLESRLYIDKGGLLETHGFYSIGFGADIEIFKNAKLEIDGKGYTNINTTIICGKHIHIKSNVIIGRDVAIRDDNGGHFIIEDGYKNLEPVTIGQHVWLGADCRILPGVIIGTGAVVAANAVVTKDVPIFTLVAGVPAKIIKSVNWR